MKSNLDDLYNARFPEADADAKYATWREIVRYLQRYIDPTAPVMDIACDRGYFTRWVRASERWASDIRDVEAALPDDVHFVRESGLNLLTQVPSGYFGTVFMSNYLEHLESAEEVIEQLRVARALIRPGGSVVVLQPNINLVGGRYWDFIDHKVALTERSLVEAAELADLRTIKLIDRFLPFTTKRRLPMNPLLVRAYLAFPPAWRILGGQTLFVGSKR